MSEPARKFSDIVGNAPVGIFEANLDGRPIMTNHALATMFGYDNPQDMLDTVSDATAAFCVFPERCRQIALSALESDGFVHAEMQYRRRDGSTFAANLYLRAVRQTDQPVILEGWVEDITARRESEEALRRSESKYKFLFDTMTQGVVVQDAAGTIIEANNAAARILGIDLDQLPGKTTEDPAWHLIHEDGTPLLVEEQPSNIVLRTGEAVSNVLLGVYLEREDRYRWIIVSSVPRCADGRVVQTMTTFTDVTDRKMAEEALRSSEERLSSILRAAPAGIGVVKYRMLAEINDRICEMTGYSREELIGQSARILYPSDEEFEFVGTEKYRQIADKGRGSVETKWKRKDGGIIEVLLSSAPIVPGNLGSGVTFTAMDITQRKQAEEALRQSEQKFRALVERAPFGAHEYELRPDGELIFTGHNQACNRILGVDCSQFVGEPIEQAFPPLTETPIPDAYRRVAATGEHYEDEQVVYSYGQIAGAYEISAFQTGPNRMAVFFRDITERKRAEEDKRAFYRETILSVTQGKLNLVTQAELDSYLRSTELELTVASTADTSNERARVASFLSRHGLHGDELTLFLTAVGEAMTNAVKHAGQGCVCAGTEDSSVWVAVSDRGPGIGTLTLPGATLRKGFSTKISMGMGYAIILEVSDRVMLATGPEGTTVLMLKSIREKDEGLRLEDLRDTWDAIGDL